MISAIRNRIDKANKLLEMSDQDQDEDYHRVSIPSSELSALVELRRSEYARGAREKLNSSISNIMVAEARAKAQAKEGDTVDLDLQRPFGLPQGEACEDVWGLIFEHVDDVEDIANLRNTCQLFREMLGKKYRTLRLIQVVLKFSKIFGRINFFLDFRRVCRASKTAVDYVLANRKHNYHLNLEPFEPYVEEYGAPSLSTTYSPFQHNNQGSNATVMVNTLQSLEIDPHRFPVKLTCLMENGNDPNNQFARHQDIVNNPSLPGLRSTCERFLKLVGSGMRSFQYISVMDRPDTYNQLIRWVELMPRLEALFVEINDESIDNGNPPALDITPFPSCPKLKRYVHSSCGFSGPLVAKIFQANPWISDVFVYYLTGGDREEDFISVLATLNTVRLESFKFLGGNTIPPPEFFQFRTEWPLKSLSLTISGHDQDDRETPSSSLFAYVNYFKATLEELEVNWKIVDTGGFLDTPKVSKLCWKLWPSFMTLEFIVALENLRYLDVDLEECQEINETFEDVQEFFDESLPSLFPALRRIRAKIEAEGQWHQLGNA